MNWNVLRVRLVALKGLIQIHRLVEVNYIIGLENEAKKYAALLGYNYQSSEWYKESYRVFNKDYEDPKDKIKKNKQNVIIRNFKKLFK